MYSLLDQADGVGPQIVLALGKNALELLGELDRELEHLPKVYGAQLSLSQRLGRVLARNGIAPEKVLAALTGIRGNQRVTDQNPEIKYQALEKYGRDLTALARQGRLDPVIGRDGGTGFVAGARAVEPEPAVAAT